MLLRSLVWVVVFASSARGDKFAVVNSDVALYERASREAPRAYLSRPGTSRGAYLTLRVVGERKDFVEVQLISTSDITSPHCYAGRDGLDAVVLDAFVRRGDLLPVTTRETTVQLDGGTSVALAAGIVALPHGERSLRDVRLAEFAVPLALSSSAVGSFYEPRTFSDPGRIVAQTTAGPIPIGRATPTSARPLPVYAIEPGAGSMIATIGVRCARLRVSLPLARLGPPAADENVLGVLTGLGSDFSVRDNAPIYWPDGIRAGSMRRRLAFARSPNDAHGRPCAPVGNLSICFDPRDVLPPRR